MLVDPMYVSMVYLGNNVIHAVCYRGAILTEAKEGEEILHVAIGMFCSETCSISPSNSEFRSTGLPRGARWDTSYDPETVRCLSRRQSML